MLVTAALAFREAGGRGRLVILILVGATFLIGRIFPSLSVAYAVSSARAVLAIGFYLFYKWRNAM